MKGQTIYRILSLETPILIGQVHLFLLFKKKKFALLTTMKILIKICLNQEFKLILKSNNQDKTEIK